MPHQLKRLKQLTLQLKTLAKVNHDYFQLPLELAKELELTGAEKKQLEKQSDRLKQEYEAELKQLQEKYDRKIKQLLPAEKQRKLDQLLGEWVHWR